MDIKRNIKAAMKTLGIRQLRKQQIKPINSILTKQDSKMLYTGFGDVDVSVPRDRRGEFKPQILKKNQTNISQDIEEKTSSSTLWSFQMPSTPTSPQLRYKTVSSTSCKIPVSMWPTRMKALMARLEGGL